MNRAGISRAVSALLLGLLAGCGGDGAGPSSSDIPFEEQHDMAEGTVATYRQYLETSTPDSARGMLIEALLDAEGVESAGLSTDGVTVWWKLESGIEYCLITETRASVTDSSGIGDLTGGGQTDALAAAARAEHLPHNQSALVLSPYAWDWNLFGFIPLQDETAFVDQILRMTGYSSTYKVNTDQDDQNVSMGDYKNFDDYGVIAISSHGGVRSNGDVFIATGVIATESLYNQYHQDLVLGNLTLVVYIDKWFTDDDILAFAFTPGWIRKYYPQRLAETLFYASVCKGLFNNTMSGAVVGSGSMYFSWDHTVSVRQAARSGKDLFTQLASNALNCGEAYQQVLDDGNGQFVPPAGSSEPTASFLCVGDEELRLVEEPIRIAATPPQWDDIGALLGSFGYDVTILAVSDLLDYDEISQYDILAINCANDLPEVAPYAAQNLRDFVSNGGKLYTSDFAFVFVEAAFPGYVVFPNQDPYIGEEQSTWASVLDGELAAYLGSSGLEIVYDLGGWVPIYDVGPGTNVLMQADVTLWEDGRSTPPRHRDGILASSSGERVVLPLAVSFDYGEGTVVHTTFHTEAQLSDMARHILEYFTVLE